MPFFPIRCFVYFCNSFMSSRLWFYHVTQPVVKITDWEI